MQSFKKVRSDLVVIRGPGGSCWKIRCSRVVGMKAVLLIRCALFLGECSYSDSTCLHLAVHTTHLIRLSDLCGQLLEISVLRQRSEV